ncbi:hypothetical protein D3C72_2088670 [compost metagenome]
MGVFNVAACHDGDVLCLDIDVARVAGDIAIGPARDHIAARDQYVSSRRHDDVAARGTQKTTCVALRHAIDDLQRSSIAAFV